MTCPRCETKAVRIPGERAILWVCLHCGHTFTTPRNG